MNKGIIFLGIGKEGKDNIEYYDVPDVEPIKLTPENYDRRVDELISERYPPRAENAIINNRMGGWDGSIPDKQKIAEYDFEYFEYQEFRKKCKIQARSECGMK